MEPIKCRLELDPGHRVVDRVYRLEHFEGVIVNTLSGSLDQPEFAYHATVTMIQNRKTEESEKKMGQGVTVGVELSCIIPLSSVLTCFVIWD